MLKRTVPGIVLTVTLLAMYLGSIISVRAASPPSIIHVPLVGTEYAVDGYGSERWGHGISLHVTDPDGLDNLLTNGEISIDILAPDGIIHPVPGDEIDVDIWPEEDPPYVSILLFSPLPEPPVLGSYEITITDRDGLSATYLTQPTVRVSDTVPTITYPPNFGVILEAHPTFTWEAFSPETTWYFLEVSGPELEWTSPHLLPDQLSYTYDGAELVRGETYSFRVFVFEDEVVGESEIRRVTSLREVRFTLGHAFTATIDIDPNTLNLKSQGQWITAYIELPEGYSVGDVDISTVMLNGEMPAELRPAKIGDYDEDAIPDLMVKFDRASIIDLLSVGEATLTITGEVNGIPFEGSDTIRVIDE